MHWNSGRIARILACRAPLTVVYNTFTHSGARGAIELMITVVRGLDALALVTSGVTGRCVGDSSSSAFAVAGACWIGDLIATTLKDAGQNAKSSTKAHHTQHAVRGTGTIEPPVFAI